MASRKRYYFQQLTPGPCLPIRRAEGIEEATSSANVTLRFTLEGE
jgi:hypothetical protein